MKQKTKITLSNGLVFDLINQTEEVVKSCELQQFKVFYTIDHEKNIKEMLINTRHVLIIENVIK